MPEKTGSLLKTVIVFGVMICAAASAGTAKADVTGIYARTRAP